MVQEWLAKVTKGERITPAQSQFINTFRFRYGIKKSLARQGTIMRNYRINHNAQVKVFGGYNTTT